MLKRLREFLTGYRYLTFSQEKTAEAAELMRREKIPFTRGGITKDGGTVVKLREKAARYFEFCAEKQGLTYTSSRTYGMPVVLGFFARRPMLIAGSIAGAVWIMYSSNIVWDIRIDGNTKTDDAEIINVLESVGFGVGTYFPAVDLAEISERYAAAQHDIAWLSVYMNNAVAEVQVREMYMDERNLQKHPVYANITAECTGVIEEVNVFEGQAAVKSGDVVRPGQVLISGVLKMKDGGARYEYAHGEAVARIAVPVSVEVLCEREKKVPTGEVKHEYAVKIFKKSLNFFQNGGIIYSSYDKISTMEQLCLFDSIYLPVWIETTSYIETVTEKETVSSDDAAAEAFLLLDRQMRAAIENAQLVSREVTAYFDNGVYRIECLLTLRKDIGKVTEFTLGTAATNTDNGD